MAFLQVVSGTMRVVGGENVLLLIPILFILVRSIYRIYIHPLSHIPGPLLPKITHLWLYYHVYVGDEITTTHRLHSIYGPFVRVAPDEVDVADMDAVAPIYSIKGGFKKTPNYANFDIDGHKTIFSTTDMDYRAPRHKAIVPMFSTKSIRGNEEALYSCVNRLIGRMRIEARQSASTGRSVNMLNIGRAMAVDAVSTHLFHQSYGGISEESERLSASSFVDAFVAVGRVFYLPNMLFQWFEWMVEKCMPSERTDTSMKAVDNYVSELVDDTPRGAENYPGRLAALGLSRSELKAQCKDLIFAGTDSTGHNIASICRYLAQNPQKYERLRKEIMTNLDAAPGHKLDFMSLPYLSACIKECLRISMANPSRPPRIVPSGGWMFKSTFFPAGTYVGTSAYELHHNPIIFPDPFSFNPERWFEGNELWTAEGNRYWFAFGAGPRMCLARNLATIELMMVTEKVVENDILRGARATEENVEWYQWFNAAVKSESIGLIWDRTGLVTEG